MFSAFEIEWRAAPSTRHRDWTATPTVMGWGGYVQSIVLVYPGYQSSPLPGHVVPEADHHLPRLALPRLDKHPHQRLQFFWLAVEHQ